MPTSSMVSSVVYITTPHKEKTVTDQRSDLTWVQHTESVVVLFPYGSAGESDLEEHECLGQLCHQKAHCIMGQNNSQHELVNHMPLIC